MTYHEREEAIKWFEARAKVATMPGAQKMFRLAIEALDEKVVDVVPVVPVVRGCWIRVNTGYQEVLVCNKCEHEVYWKSNYCPNCGAKMEED